MNQIKKSVCCGTCLVPAVLIIATLATITNFTTIEQVNDCLRSDVGSSHKCSEWVLDGSSCGVALVRDAKIGAFMCLAPDNCNVKLTVDSIPYIGSVAKEALKAVMIEEGVSTDTGINLYCGWQSSIVNSTGMNPSLFMAAMIITVIMCVGNCVL